MAGYVNTTGKIGCLAVVLDVLLFGGYSTARLGKAFLLGSVAAGVLSYATNGSLLLAAVHALLNWYYMAWRIIGVVLF